MGSIASNFLEPDPEPPRKKQYKRKEREKGGAKSYRFFMRNLRKYLKTKKPHLTKPEVKLLGKVLWGELAPQQKRVFTVELTKITRKKHDAKRKSAASSRLSSLFDNRAKRSTRRRKKPATVQENPQSRDQQAGPSACRSIPSTSGQRCEGENQSGSMSVSHSLPEAFDHSGSRMNMILTTAVSRHYGDRQESKPRAKQRRGLRTQANKRRSSTSRAKKQCSRRPHSMVARVVSHHFCDGDMEMDDDSSDYEGGFLYSGASTTSMSSTLISSEKGDK